MKKIINVILVFAIFVGSVAYAKGEDNSITEMQSTLFYDDERINTILSLNIMQTTSDGEFKYNDYLSRGELVEIIYNLVNYKNNVNDVPIATKQIFKDVDIWNWAAGYLEELYARDIVKGYPDNTFRLLENINLSEFCKIALYAAGYKDYIEARSDDVLTFATTLGLLRNVNIADSENLTKQEVAYLLYNLLNVKVNVPVSVSNGGITYVDNETFLNHFMDLFIGYGIVNKTPATSLKGGAGCHTDTIEVDYSLYSCQLENINELLGMYVKYYYTANADDSKQIVLIDEYKNEVITFVSKNIVSYKNKKYTYYEGKNKLNAQVFAGCDIIYNGMAVSEEKYYVPSYGSVKLIDNTNDGLYDVVIVSDYVNYIVESVDTMQKKLLVKKANSEGTSISIDLSEYDKVLISDEYGKNISLSVIMKNTVISCAISDNSLDYISIIANNTIIDGVINEYSNNEFVVDGNTYYTANEYYSSNKFEADVSVSLHLDCFGNIAYIDNITDASGISWKYGYLINATANTQSMDSSMDFKVLDQDGAIKILSSGNKLIIDGVKKSLDNNDEVDFIINQIGTVIRYKSNDLELKAIDTALIKSAYDFNTVYNESTSDSLYLRVKGTLQFKGNHRVFRRRGTCEPYGDMILGDNPIVFNIPLSNGGSVEDKDYTVSNSVAFDTWANMELYNDKYNKCTAEIVVVHGTDNPSYSYYTPLMIIERVVQALNDNGEETWIIEGFESGSLLKRKTDSRNIFNNNYVPQRGDVVRYVVDKDGNITDMELIYGVTNQGKLNSNNYLYASDTSFDALMRYVYGDVQQKNGNYVIFKYGNEQEMYNTSGIVISVYDQSMRNTNGTLGKTYVGTADDIKDVKTYGDKASKLIVHTTSSQVVSLIVIN